MSKFVQRIEEKMKNPILSLIPHELHQTLRTLRLRVEIKLSGILMRPGADHGGGFEFLPLAYAADAYFAAGFDIAD